VRLARALVQQPDVLLLDEPTSHLDFAHQLDLLQLVRGLRLTTMAALHDLNLAAMFCDDLAVISAGRIVAANPRPTCSPQSSSPTSTTRNASSRRTPSPAHRSSPSSHAAAAELTIATSCSYSSKATLTDTLCEAPETAPVVEKRSASTSIPRSGPTLTSNGARPVGDNAGRAGVRQAGRVRAGLLLRRGLVTCRAGWRR
jgi:ABC-type multidrug transport system ATPase subunit